MKGFAFALAGLAWSLSISFADESLRLYAPFEDSITPDVSASKFPPVAFGEVGYTDGIKGHAVICDGAKGYLNFYLDEVFHEETGTLSIWMKPVDWEDGDGNFHFLAAFISSGDQNRQRLLFYKYHTDSQLTLLVDSQSPAETNLIQKDPGSWSQDTWRHYVMTWTPDELAIYLDGALFATAPRTVRLQGGDFKNLLVGYGAFVPKDVGKSAFDELRVYDRALTPDEVATLHNDDKTTSK